MPTSSKGDFRATSVRSGRVSGFGGSGGLGRLAVTIGWGKHMGCLSGISSGGPGAGGLGRLKMVVNDGKKG
ncbi:hypothetical protein ACH5RR_037021 [Cinchona calisaya]|uniref:Uncharacterized protein n=1 Tax=Cinchona calisaya TaxID=153742 RepID=A0ABD2Y4X0_9GENT